MRKTKKPIIFAISILGATLLSGCVTAGQAQMNAASEKISYDIQAHCSYLLNVSPAEAAAWVNLEGEVSHCPDPNDLRNENLSDGEIETALNCAAKAMKLNVRPTSYSKSKFDEYLESRGDEWRSYLKGDIDKRQFDQMAATRWESYFATAFKNGKGSYYNWAQCRREAFGRNMPQSYPAWPALHEHLTAVSKMARAADKSKMEPQDFDIEVQELWTEFAAREAQILRQVQASNAAAWRDWSRSMQEYSAELQRQQNSSNNGFKNTTCNVSSSGRSMNCTEW